MKFNRLRTKHLSEKEFETKLIEHMLKNGNLTRENATAFVTSLMGQHLDKKQIIRRCERLTTLSKHLK